MGIQAIISSAQAIIAEAQALPSTPGVSLPPPAACLAGTVPAATPFTPPDHWAPAVGYHLRQMGQWRDGWIPFIGTSVTAGWDVTPIPGPLVVLSLIPNGNGQLSQGTMNAVNGLFTTKLAGRQKCVVVDITNPLKDTDGFMKTSLSIGDRLHPNAAGYAVINPLVKAALAQVTQ